jgi:hypothetical protein
MPTNFDNTPWLATRNQRVRINCFCSITHLPIWANIGVVSGISLDKTLTQMNKKNIQVYRILVDFGDGKIASILPRILKRV